MEQTAALQRGASQKGLDRNRQLAGKLRQAAELLDATGANPFRVAAYRHAAETVERLDRDISEVDAQGGVAAIDALPSIGPSIARAIAELLHSGRWGFLEHLRTDMPPETLFRTIPGIGPKLAARLHGIEGVDTLQSLETAAYEGRLDAVPGIGPRRAAAIRNAVAGMLGRVRSQAKLEEPGVDVLLDVDREYREKAVLGQLRQIAPKRFNPSGEAWLPILQTRRGSWEFTALYSNTARAHQLGRTKDWVVLYFREPRHGEMQRTIVTERRPPLAGKRIVRGRELECRRHYELESPGAGR